MNKAMIVVAMHAALLAACTAVPRLDSGVCGNRIVEANEDCDGYSGMGPGTACGAPGTSNECSFVCDVAGGVVCPEGWGCGQDGRCRQPLGRFDADGRAPIRFPAESLAIGDLDGDGYPDLVGTQGSLLSVRFGSETGEFSAKVDVPVPQPVGPLTFALLDDDSLLDVILPISGGLVPLLGREDRGLETVAYSSLDLRTARFGVRALVLDAYPDDQNSELLAIVSAGMRFFDNPTDAYVKEPLGDRPLSDLVDDLATGDVDGDGSEEFVIAFTGDRTVHLCRGTMSGNDERTLQPICYDTLAVAADLHRGGTRLTDVDGDGHLDLLAAVSPGTGGAEVAVQVAHNRRDGTFDGFTAASVFGQRTLDPRSSNLCERSGSDTRADPWPLAAADFNRDGRADYVFSDAIAIARFGTSSSLPAALTETVCVSSSPWKSAVITDINGDGWLDVAVNLDGSDGIDIYINAGEPARGEMFNKFHVNTDSPPLALRTGDFDGDLVMDIAFYERVGSGAGGTPLDRISVIFGSRSGAPSAPVAMGTFHAIQVFEPLLSPFEELNGRDFIDDLVVVSLPPGAGLLPPEEAVPVGTILQGDSSRRMLSPIFLVDGDGNADRFLSALVGDFAADGGRGIMDIAVIAEREFLAPDPGGGALVRQKQSRVWLLRGVDGSGALAVPRVSAELPPTTEYFDYTCALWVTGNVDPGSDALDEVIGIDRSASCTGEALPSRMIVSKVPDPSSDGAPLEEIVPMELSDTYAFVSSLALRDMDGDGAPDVLALFAGQGTDDGQPPGRSAVVVFWNAGGRFSPGDVTVFELPDGERILDLAPIQMAGDAVPELLVLASDRVIALALDPGTRTYRLLSDPVLRVAPAPPLPGNGPLHVADANGDGLDDIVVRTIIDGEHALLVALQRPREPLGSASGESPRSSQEGEDMGGGGS
jgi:hypothetical protein